MVRAASVSFHAVCAALGAAAVARPALLWVHGAARGGFATAWHRPLGLGFALLGLAIAAAALTVALDVALHRRPLAVRHATLLALVAVAAALRTVAEPMPTP